MPKLITISPTQSINWPKACAKCRTKNNLILASATSGMVKSVSPTLTGAIKIESELLDLYYPICKNHSQGLAFDNFLTRNTTGIKFLRGIVYFLGSLSLLGLILSLTRILTRAPNNSAASIETYILQFVLAATLIAVVRAFRTLPVRITKQTPHSISIQFNNENYAAEFSKMNA